MPNESLDALKTAPVRSGLASEPSETLVGVVFSKDRPLQLDATIRSFLRHARDAARCSLHVLYRASDAQMGELYGRLAAEHPETRFVEEKDFREDLLRIVRDSRHVLFVVDDNVFVRPFSLAASTEQLEADATTIGISLRLGQNTDYCYMLSRPQTVPDFMPLEGELLRYRWPGAEADFGYPLEVSSSLYRTADLLSLLEGLHFANPNTLEAGLAALAPRFAAGAPHLCCYQQSVAFCAPVNMVQDVCQNRSGNRGDLSAKRLAKLFADGHRIDVAHYDGFLPNGCHQEIDLRTRAKLAVGVAVSVVIPCFRQAEFLKEAVESVVAQSFDDWECIIVDDGSPDDTAATAERLIAAHPDRRIRLLRQRNQGVAAARNAAILNAKGRYVLPLDADDALHPDFLGRAVALIETEPTAAIVYVDEQNFGESHHVHQKGESSLQALKYQNVHDYCSLYRYEVWEAVGGYSPAMYLGGEDWSFWVAAAKSGYRSIHLPEPLFHYRSRPGTSVATTLANLAEVHAQIVVHHPDIYSSAELLAAEARLSYLSQPNRERLMAAAAKSPGNAVLERFLDLATGRSASAVRDVSPLEENPLVSVVVVTRDRPDLLIDALRSLVEQTYANWEAVVVNDGGCDVEALVSTLDPQRRLSYFRHPVPRGPAAARNTAISFSSGNVVCYLDDDDTFLPHHLDTVVTALRQTGAEFVFTDAEYVIEDVRNGKRNELSRQRPYEGLTYSRSRLHVSNFIPINTWAHRRELVERTGPFDPTLAALEDWDLLLRFARATELQRVGSVTVEVRQRPKASDHVNRNGAKHFSQLYRRIYARYPVELGGVTEAERRTQLESLDSELAGESSSRAEEETYWRWLARNELKESDAQYMAERMMLEWRSRPLFHLVALHEAGEEEALADTLDALGQQLYRGWGLSVISASEAPEGLADVPNIEWLAVSGDRLEAANAVAEQSSADWFLMLEAGATLTGEALFSLADYSQRFPSWQVIYADEDRIGPGGDRHDPRFKPDFNLDLLRSTPYVGPFVAIRRELLVRIGGYRTFSDATAYDLVFRAVETVGESSIGHVAKVLFHRSDRFRRVRDEAVEGELCRKIVEGHLARIGVPATVRSGSLPRTQDIEYGFEGSPKVSVVVPATNQANLLPACIDSLLAITSYPDFEVVIVDNGSTEADAIDYLRDIAGRDSRVRVIRYDKPDGFSTVCNLAAERVAGELILFLSSDTQILHDDWMTRMVGHAMRPEVGAVGARLVDRNGAIQHAGTVLGMMGTVGTVGIGAPIEDPGYMGRLQVVQSYSAVSGRCLMIRKALYQEMGGLDEKDFEVHFSDVDLCLRLVTAGYRNVWTPQATLVHHGSGSLKGVPQEVAVERARGERDALHRRWGERLAADPAFNRNLSLASQRVCVEAEIAPAWDPTFRERPRVMAFPLDAQGTGHYRVWGPLAALDRAALAQFSLLPAHGFQATQVRVPNLPELLRAAPDTLLVQHGYLDLFLDWIERYRRHSRTFLVFGQDDNLLDVPDDNPLKKALVEGLEGRMARAMGQCDRLIVTTQPLAEVYRRFIEDIRVVPNQLDGSRWNGLKSVRRAGRKPRVGWAGALQHMGDLKWLEPVVRALHREVEWVFMGMCPDNLRPYVAEFHAPVPLTEYPAALAGLSLDLAIAPLEMHRFNEAKSDLRILEYGALGWPVIATDIYPYQGKPVTVLGNQPDRWVAAIRERVNDLDALALEGDRLREWVLKNRMLENNLDTWIRALFSDEVLRESGVLPALAA